MKLTLAVLAGVVGLIVTASAVMLIWFVMQQKQKMQNKPEELQANNHPEEGHGAEEQMQGSSPLQSIAPLLLQWTFFDYALIGVFAVGSLFLFTDVIAVIRDAASYPLYHYGYLLCGFVFTLLSMLFMILRFATVLSLVRSGRAFSAADKHSHPGETNQAE
ncbi:hypothetical protein [Paenibacillus rigui]|uniref:Uncharacterized protein n=1 Tax=Paenibacillus rigui TaxID=554312 RepID=A0A229UL46_9BACL|nr:hypothetical protein [Paenibacillus rigui]OXM84092.1 hypothetical protein CF651_21865 [Paenibacillus rigui]